MAAKSRFWDKIADRYAQQPIGDETAYQEKLKKIRALLTPESELLEFACGTGSTALTLAPDVRQITAIDVSGRMLMHCERKRAQAGIQNIRFQQETIENFACDPGQFDVVLGMSILHLLDDRDTVIRKIFWLLKPGGCFVSSTVCLGDTMPWFRFIAPLGRWIGKMPRVQTLTEDELVRSLKQAGFVIAERWRPKANAAVFVIARKPER